MSETTSRQEHLEWCKKRALEELEFSHSPINAINSMISDLRKHPQTADHPGIILTGVELLIRGLQTPEQVRHHIEGFR